MQTRRSIRPTRRTEINLNQAGGDSLKKNVTVKNARSSGYSGGNGWVGFDVDNALKAEFVNASTSAGLAMVNSEIEPSRCT